MSKIRQKILETALELFNEKGSANITTNHIVQACDMSPGNLYYHFKNKEALIRELFESMTQQWNKDIGQGTLESGLFSVLNQYLSLASHYYKKYLFIHKELLFLLQKDPLLAQMHETIHKQRLEEFKTLLTFYVHNKELRDIDDKTIDFLADTVWIYSLFWMPYQEIGGKEITLESLDLIRLRIEQLIKPYLNLTN